MTKDNLFIITGFALSLLIVPNPASAEQVEKDIYAAVIVNPVFTMVVDNAEIDFGYIEPGKSTELKSNTYYNSVKCNSNKGKTWYLKVSVMDEISGPTPDLAPESFKCKVYNYVGDGTPIDGWQPFGNTPQTVYTSGGRDNTGEDAVVRLQYKLDLPATAVGGYYRTKVLYTMTDIP